ncbi:MULTISPECIES: AAA family ATPase [Algoriphagus]|jgi:DNA repair protein SbcC/Rad50|uniref:Exonuclease SbcC n=1 Tax=Algoriphagus winogradskyi TaxID=237017 RepID=A0ABY1NSC7_9BACT|nr:MULTISPECIES: hypothetical protein [Algoriphagus]QYH39993.1 hypothetical protein GYM62_14800 [Algoriphagus sp. NBT04N3]SMP16987.1 exonuclease SbcC [Algoriphagus winogradskyi]|tara:strand:- start:3372 stop:6536 length:3165 start_codon:yes stop_codon:yes gene_type:complete
MKFKKVEIQAFRAYDKAEDGTFDFQLNNQRNADFISIYAPNGFGKTSFYDAVEWGYTSNIHRFLRKQKFNQESSKSQKNINSEEGSPEHKSKYQILRNHNADDATQGYVKLFTTNSDKPTVRNIPIPRSGMVDYKFDSKETENDFFQKVILSQEWIDAFLKEDDAAERYKTFISYFGNQQLDKYYTSIVSLIKTTDAKIKQLTTDLKGVQKEIQFNGDHEILKKVNDKITGLRSIYSELTLIDSDFSDKDFVHYDSQLIELQHALVFQLNKNNGVLNVIKLAFQGNEEVLGLNQYEAQQARMPEVRKLYETYKSRLNSLDDLSKLNDELNVLLDQVAEIQKSQAEVKEIQRIFPGYVQTQKEIDAEKTNARNAADQRDKAEASLAEANNAILKAAEAENNKLNQISATLNRKKDAQSIEQKVKQDQSEETKLFNQKSNEQDKLTEIGQKIVTTQQHIKRVEDNLTGLSIGKYPNTADQQYASFVERIEKAEQEQKRDDQIRAQLINLDTQIQSREEFNSEIERLVALGSQIVNRTQTSECPLCNHDFKTYSDLASNIAGNTLLAKDLQIMLEQRTILQQQQNQTLETINQLRQEMEADFRNELDGFDDKLKKQLAEESSMKRDLETIDRALAEINQTKLDFKGLLNNNTYTDYLSELDRQIGQQEKELTTAKENTIEAKAKADLAREKFETTKKQIELFVSRQEELAERQDYLRVLEYSLKNLELGTPDPEELEAFSTKLDHAKDDLEKQRAEKALMVAETSAPIIGMNREDVDAQVRQARKSLNQAEEAISSFESFLIREFSYFPDEPNTAKDFLLEFDRRLKSDIEKDQRTQLDLQVLKEQLKAVLPYLKYQMSVREERDLREQLGFLKDTVRKRLNTEKNKVATHLDKEISSFFYQDLINDLYEKIDPHPTYRKIRFLCDFKDDKPKLNVCVVGDTGEEMLIPNLYFSTAQLNILSLSIFLAKALNVTDKSGKYVDCIFIDDPIQSMDSINILSTIDLLRSLVHNNKKQIILSTHDENFHNLLQKKIPTNLFDSKFIELETFGKVKRDEIY